MKFPKLASLPVMLTVLFLSCNQEPDSKLSAADTADAASGKNEREDGQAELTDTVTQQTPGYVANNQPAWDKKIVRTASLNVQVGDYRKYNSTLHSGIAQFGAYISEEEASSSEFSIATTMTIKVPVAQFEELINFLTPDSLKLLQKKVTSQDVTAQVIDSRSRMMTRKEVRERYLSLLKQAKSTKEIIELEKEVNQIQEDIESANSRLEYLSHSSAYSTVNLQFFQVLGTEVPKDNSPGFLDQLLQSFTNGLDWLGKIFISLIAVWPLWIIIMLGMIGFKRWKAARTPVKNQV